MKAGPKCGCTTPPTAMDRAVDRRMWICPACGSEVGESDLEHAIATAEAKCKPAR